MYIPDIQEYTFSQLCTIIYIIFCTNDIKHTNGLVGVVGEPALLLVEGTCSLTGLNLFLTGPGDEIPDNDWVNFRLLDIEFVNEVVDWEYCVAELLDVSQAFELPK